MDLPAQHLEPKAHNGNPHFWWSLFISGPQGTTRHLECQGAHNSAPRAREYRSFY